eukprot:gb/GEZN01008018.1/.p1 GENE.gb/GEZN01008018.1/~~gb/GEZN01008018.1/.p1  ORF type:complete len:464 (-),score=49.39 gb/GEZN01008018.1/:51-1442(-)
MSATDYVALEDGWTPRGMSLLVHPVRATIGVVGVMLGAAGVLTRETSNWLKWGVGNVQSNHVSISKAYFIDKARAATPSYLLTSSISWVPGRQDFIPQQGVEKVVVRPGAPGALQSILPPGMSGKCSIFLYSLLSDECVKSLEQGAQQTQGRLYGAKRLSPGNTSSLALITGSPSDVLDGRLLSWPTLRFTEKLHFLDTALGYDPSHPDQAMLRRGIVAVVRSDGSSVQAYWYYSSSKQDSQLQASDGPSGLAHRSADLEAKAMLSYLSNEKLLGLQEERDVIVLGKSYRPGVIPGRHQKIVHFFRHGQGFHNLLADVYRGFGHDFKMTDASSPYRRPELVDVPLTALGRDQAEKLQIKNELKQVQLVVTSPMTRAVQTAQLAFPPDFFAPSFAKTVALLAHPNCTESLGQDTCNRRRPLAKLKHDFPQVDWSLINSEEETRWSPTVAVSSHAGPCRSVRTPS